MWQPISTAPHNKMILLAGPSGYRNVPLRCEIGEYSADRKAWVNHGNDRFTDGGDEPTCWMPLPENSEQFGSHAPLYQLMNKFGLSKNQSEHVLGLYDGDLQKASDHIEEWGPNDPPWTLSDLYRWFPMEDGDMVKATWNAFEQNAVKAARHLMMQKKIKLKKEGIS